MKDTEFKTNILNKASNHKVYYPIQATYYVGFPSVAKRDSKQKGSQGKQIISENTPVYEQRKKDQYNQYNQYDFCNKPFVTKLQSNANRRLIIPKFPKDAIIEEMKNLRSIHCTHVYKFACQY